jgi:hypothetical protein
MADFIQEADEALRDSVPADTAEREADSFHRWVNRRWPRRDHPENETVEA